MDSYIPQDQFPAGPFNVPTVEGTDPVGRTFMKTVVEPLLDRTQYVFNRIAGAGTVARNHARALANTNQTRSGLPTIDTIVFSANQVVFLNAQTAPAENGPWVVSAGAWTRPSDFVYQAVPGTVFYIAEGATFAGTSWQLTTSDPIVLGTTALTWVQLVTTTVVAPTPNTVPLRDGSGVINATAFDSGANADLNLRRNSVVAITLMAAAVAFAQPIAFGSSVASPSITQTVLAGTGATAGNALTVAAQAGQQQSGANANNNGGDLIATAGQPGTGGSGAAGSAGSVYLRGATIQIRDVNNGKAAYFLIAPAGSTILQFEKGVSPGIGQDGQTTDVATSALTITPQTAFVTATGSNRRPGNVVVALTDATNSGGALLNPAFAVTQSGRPACLISSRRDSASSSYGAIWLGNVTTSTATEQNMCFGSDGSAVAFLNAPTGGTLYLTIGLSTLAQVMTTSANQIGIPNWTWNDGLTPQLNQQQSATGVPATFSISAAQGKAGSVGAILALNGGAGGTPGTNLGGAVQVGLGTAVANASAKLSLMVTGVGSVLDISQTAANQVDVAMVNSAGILDLVGGSSTGHVKMLAGGAARVDVQTSLFQLLACQQQWVHNSATYGTTTTFDLTLGNLQTVQFGAGNITTLTISNMKDGGFYILVFIQDATGSRTLALPSNLKVTGGTFTLTATANKRDALLCWSDGTNLYEVGRAMNV